MNDKDPNRNILKLSLNLPALERLIGGNSDIELEIRQGIAEAFAKRYLKSLADTETFREATAAIQTAIQQEIRNLIGKRASYYSDNIELTAEFKAKLTQQISKAADDFITSSIRAYIEANKETWQSYADRRIQYMLDDHIERKIKEGIDARLKAAAGMKK